MKTAREQAEEIVGIRFKQCTAPNDKAPFNLLNLAADIAAALEEKEREIEIIRQQRDEAVSAQANAESRLTHSKNVADGVWKTHESQFAELKSELAEAVKLLKPFASLIAYCHAKTDDCRAAAAFVAKHKGQ